MTRNAYDNITSDLRLALKVMTEALGENNPRLAVLIRAICTVARWAQLPADEEIYDRMLLEIARKHPEESDTNVFYALSAVAFDLTQQGSKEQLGEAEVMVREALSIATALPDGMVREDVQVFICAMYLQLARILMALDEPDKAHAETSNLLAYNALTMKELGHGYSFNGLGDVYQVVLDISKRYLALSRYDDSVRVANEAVALIPQMIDETADFTPNWLRDILDTISGHAPVYETPVDAEPGVPATAKS